MSRKHAHKAIGASFIAVASAATGLASFAVASANTTNPGKPYAGVTLTVATVNNPDMVIMEKETSVFTQQTGIKVKYVTLPENELRTKVTQDVATNAGKFDIATIGNYDAPIWGRNKWIVPLTPMFSQMAPPARASYDLNDVIKPIRNSLSYGSQLYALPFYGESSMLYYRKDLFAKAHLTMPVHPTWAQVQQFAAKLNNPKQGVYGIVLRGDPGWGEILAPLDTVINSFGGQWYDMKWRAQFNNPATVKAVKFYVNLVQKYGEPGATSSGFTECETDLASGKAAMWYDATVAAGFLNDPKQSQVVGKIGYAMAPTQVTSHGAGWQWAWSLGIESASKNQKAAFQFLTWATSKKYINLVGKTQGWVVAPPGTRYSTYSNPNYAKAAPFAKMVLKQIMSADSAHPTLHPVPYTGVQFIEIPEFQDLGTTVSQYISAAIAGRESVDKALQQSQQAANQTAQQGGYQH